MRWFYLTAYASAYGRDYTLLTSKNKPVLITKPYTIEGITYGTKDNPSYYAQLYDYRQLNSEYIFYYRPFADYPSQSVEGLTCRSLLYLVENEEDVDFSYSRESASKYSYENRKIKGKWRIHDKLISTDKYRNLSNYLITVVGQFELTNGYTQNFNLIGADIDGIGEASTVITFGNLSLGSYDYNTPTVDVPEQYKDMLVNFGDTEQNIPSFLYDFIEFNFDKVYDNTYTVKSDDGVILAESEHDMPPIKKTSLFWSAGNFILSLTTIEDFVITLEWSSTTPEGKKLKGLSIEPNGKIIVPIGDRVVDILRSVDFYMVYEDIEPLPVQPLPRPIDRPLPDDAYNINLYTNTAEANRVDKTAYLTSVRTLRGVMRESSSVTDLTITIQYPTYPDFNYVRIPELKRYYFVNDITLINANMYELDLSVDPLMSYKDAILGLTAFVDRNEFLSNPYIIDKKRAIEQGYNIETDTVNNQIFNYLFNPDTDVMFVMNGYKLGVYKEKK